MKKAGRKGLAEVLTLYQGSPGQPPAPPIELSEAEAALWRVVCSAKPWDWFTPDTFPLLKEFCRASVQLDVIAEGLQSTTLGDTDAIRKYMALSDRQDKLRTTIKVLAASMRISQQSRYDAQKAGTRGRAQPTRKPWERESNA